MRAYALTGGKAGTKGDGVCGTTEHQTTNSMNDRAINGWNGDAKRQNCRLLTLSASPQYRPITGIRALSAFAALAWQW